MNRPSFQYPDENGTVLGVEPGPGPAGDIAAVAAVSVADMTCYVLAEHRAQVAAGLWTGSGAPAPVILERPGSADAASPVSCGGILVGRLGDKVTVGLYGIQPEELPPFAAREVAALMAVRAAEIEADQPDPAEVEELAALIRSELYPPSESIGLRPSESDRTAARAALRWMRDKERAS